MYEKNQSKDEILPQIKTGKKKKRKKEFLQVNFQAFQKLRQKDNL